MLNNNLSDSLTAESMQKNKNFIICDCGSEAIEIKKFDDEVFISLWIMAWYSGSILGEIKERIKTAFSILFKGRYRYQEIILNKDEFTKLKDTINEL